ncbi:MAG: glycosyltransferase family 2 protein [Sulfuricurvum sp.]|nr:glycosyltransferase family 2 protein [Sulfuricurvum sp.]
MENNLFSIAMTTYNGEKFLRQQLDSIVSQTYTNLEIVICDDRSTDSTYKILQEYVTLDDRIKLHLNDENLGPIKNFEKTLSLCSGTYIALADQDDIWMPNKVETMLNYLKDADIVLGDCHIIDKNGIILFDSFFEQTNSKSGLINNLCKNSYIGCCMAFNRKILAKALPFPSDIPMHDWWIGLIGEAFGKSIFCKEKLIAYRRHETNASASVGISQYGFLKKVYFRIIMLRNLLKRYFFHA